MTTETVLLLLILLGGIATMPGAYALYKSRSQGLTLQAAQHLEEELSQQLERMHKRILKLEGENAKLQNKQDDMRMELNALEHKNNQLASFVRRLIKQLEHNGIIPEVSYDDVDKLSA